MSQITDFACPNITCEGFNKVFQVECWDKDEEEFGEGQIGDPCCIEQLCCVDCGSFCYSADKVKMSFNKKSSTLSSWERHGDYGG